MIRFGIILGLAAGLVAIGELGLSAFAATDPTAMNPIETPTNQSIVESGLEAVSTASPVARARTGNPLWAVPLRSLSATRERPIFSPSRRPPSPAVVAAPFVEAVKPPPPKPPEPDHPLLTLIGTIVGESEGIGIFLDQVTNNVVRIRTGELRSGWLLRSVQGREAIFENDLRAATLAIPAPGEAQQPVQPSTAGPRIARSGDTWMDGDGQLIRPPPRK
jgi:general secretion pathway protein N